MHLLATHKIITAIVTMAVVLTLLFAAKRSHVTEINVYRKAIYSIPDKFNTLELVSTSEHTISHLIYEGLFTVNKFMETVPLLVKDWTLDSTKTQYTFSIHRDIKFSNGSLMTLSDVKDSLDRLLDNKSPVKDMFKKIKSIKIVNDSIVVKIDSPYPPFISLLASPFAKVLKMKKGHSYPIGTGPFVFKNIGNKKGKKVLVLERNPFHRERPLIEQMELWELTEPEALKLVGDGFIHDTSIYLSVRGKHKSNKKVKQNFSSTAVTWLFPLNTKSKKLSDIGLRKCINKVFRKSEFIKKFRPDHKEAIGFLPPTLLGGAKKIQQENLSKINCYKYDGIELNFDIPVELGEQVPEMCKFVKHNFGEIGIKIICNPIKFGILVDRIKQASSEISFLSQTLDYPDVEYYFTTYESNSHFNISNFSSKVIDQLLNQVRFSSDRFDRNEIYYKLNQYLYDNYVTVNISYPNHISYRHICLRNFNISTAGETYINYKSIGIDSSCNYASDFNDG
ncbi:MAG: ABC transporter substrate-binding protein [Bacteriovoracaceae bacterium]|nr:ABC transporter substrate-binding protein [Bacteriovoracaceae bacterium]